MELTDEQQGLFDEKQAHKLMNGWRYFGGGDAVEVGCCEESVFSRDGKFIGDSKYILCFIENKRGKIVLSHPEVDFLIQALQGYKKHFGTPDDPEEQPEGVGVEQTSDFAQAALLSLSNE